MEDELIEEQREALRTAESAATRAMRLKSVIDELSTLAVAKLKQGDEAAAREALKEKALAQEMLDRTTEKSILNYKLASGIGTKIAEARKVEQSASSSGKKTSLEESLQDLTQQIKRKAADDLNEALERVRTSNKQKLETLEEARARLRELDRGTMAEVRKVMDRKRRGEFVSNDELDWAFRMLDQTI